MTFAACGMSPVLCSARIFAWAALPPLTAWAMRIILRARPWLLSVGLALGVATIAAEDVSEHATDGLIARLPAQRGDFVLLRLVGAFPDRHASPEKRVLPRLDDHGREEKDARFTLAVEARTSTRWQGCRRRGRTVPS